MFAGRTSYVLGAVFVVGAIGAAAQPTVTKMEPPDWWTGTRTNPVRVLVHGSGFEGARVAIPAPLTASHVAVNATGTFLFVDVAIPANARSGSYALTIRTAAGAARSPFSLVDALPAAQRFQGFSPDDVIYLIMPDRFSDGDTTNDDPAASKGLFDRAKSRYYHGGDFKGVIDHLDYLKSLGVTAIWLNPWYDNYNRLNEHEKYDGAAITDYHGYGAVDFYGVEEHFGDLRTLRELVDQAHRRGMKVIQDQVANHTGPYHPWTKDSPKPTWYHGTVAHHLANDFVTWPLMDLYASPESKRKVLDGWFIDILPDLNQDDPETRRYLIQNSLWWVGRTGLDAIRQDTLPYAPRDYWRAWTDALRREFPKVNVVGEVFDGDPAFTSFFQGGAKRFDGVDSGVQSVFDFPLYFAIRKTFANGEALRNIPQTLGHDRLYPDSNLLVTFLGLHDVARFMSEPGATLDGLKLAFTVLLTARGVPMIYYGDEIAMRGGGDPDNRRDFPGGWAADSHNAFEDSGRTADENAVWSYVQRLIALRKDTPALRGAAKTTNLYSSEQQWVFLRTSGTSTSIIAINNDSKSADVSCVAPDGSYTDRAGSAGSVEVHGGHFTLTLPARSAAVLVR
ncbi:MAG TPA: alpha-amylase family glycosyl hydrolase [Bryobacteraceae bacterium]